MTWLPIETAPHGTRVLVVNDEGEMDVCARIDDWLEREEWVRSAKDGEVYRTVRVDAGYWDTERAHCPTHWMPLPDPPTRVDGPQCP